MARTQERSRLLHLRGSGRRARSQRDGGCRSDGLSAPLASLEASPAQFELTPEQREIGELARDIAEREIAPHVAQWDREHYFPVELLAKLGAAGLMGLTVPEAYGGAGADYVSYALAIEALAAVDAGTAVTLSVHLMIAAALERLGDEAQKARYLPKLAAGEALAGFALTEPDAGSDAASLRSTARREGDEWVLRGRKQWCTNGGFAAVTMGMFRTGGPGSKGVSAFLIDQPLAGLTVEKVTEKMGIHTSNTVDLAFDDVRLPASALLGREGSGLSNALGALTTGRIGIAAQAAGILAACLSASVKFAKEREAFGKPIGAFEGISFKLAQMSTDLAAARALIYRAAALCDAGRPFALEASQAKLFASSAARRHSGEAVQIHGGYGYTTEFPVERYYRDAKITEIYEGTSEIQQVIIARALLGRVE